jgi:hypothetical protein
MRSGFFFTTCGLCVCALLGCVDGHEKTYPVSGSLLVNDAPAPRAQIVFHPVGEDTKGKVKPVAVVGEDGAFKVTTFMTNDGAPVGDYMVTIVWPKYETVQGEEVEGEDTLRGQYNEPRSPFLKLSIKPKENRIPPIKLTIP